MKVFVTGANGYIGFAVAGALSRAGHDVVGLVRSAKNTRRLELIEIEPVVGDLSDVSRWLDAARSSQALVHCAAERSNRTWELDRHTMEELLHIATQTALLRKVVYTSGVWLYGATGHNAVDESSPLHPLTLVEPRVAIEHLVLSADTRQMRTLVIRPGCVYGGAGGLTGGWFEEAGKEGKIQIIGTGNERWAMVHVEDLANLYLRAVESPYGGEVFNATDRSRFTLRECAEAASFAAGSTGHVEVVPLEAARKKMGAFAEALALDQHVNSSKAEKLLGWTPHHPGFADGAPRYFRSWQAARAAV